MIQNLFFFFFFFFRGVGSLSQPRLNIFTVGNMRVMICLGQGGLRSLSASSYFLNHLFLRESWKEMLSGLVNPWLLTCEIESMWKIYWTICNEMGTRIWIHHWISMLRLNPWPGSGRLCKVALGFVIGFTQLTQGHAAWKPYASCIPYAALKILKTLKQHATMKARMPSNTEA